MLRIIKLKNDRVKFIYTEHTIGHVHWRYRRKKVRDKRNKADKLINELVKEILGH